MLRAARVVDRPWCLDVGSMLSRDAGASEQQLAELDGWQDQGYCRVAS